MNYFVVCHKDGVRVGGVSFTANTEEEFLNEIKDWIFVYNTKWKSCDAYHSSVEELYFKHRVRSEYEVVDCFYDPSISEVISKAANIFTEKTLDNVGSLISWSREEKVQFFKRHLDVINKLSDLLL